MDIWSISREERAGHDGQFGQLAPGVDHITGQQARDFFLRSGLPQPVLAQIWGLVVKGSEGRMSRKEFSIAMALITRRLKGVELPTSLPPGMLRDPTGGFPPSGAPASPSRKSSIVSATVPGSSSSIGVDWTIPQNQKLKFTQMFNQHDKQRMGYLTGVQARSLLLHSGLSQTMLAHIWGLSDYDNDGKLSADEFCIAMHLIDQVKSGQTLPATLPKELLPSVFRRKASLSSVSNGGNGEAPVLSLSSNAGDLRSMGISQTLTPMGQTQPVSLEDDDSLNIRPVTFEDRRKENFDKGNEELEKRRRALQDTLKKEQAMREAVERAEAEKRDRIKQEQERRRQLELERQMARQREIEEEKEEQRRRALEQREAARRELERQRQQEWLRQRRLEMEEKKNSEMAKVRGLRTKSNDLAAEHQSLMDKSSQLIKDIDEAREQVTAQTRAIDGMRESRDQKMATITDLERKLMDSKRQLAATPGYLGKPLTKDDPSTSDSHDSILKVMGAKKEKVDKFRSEFDDIDQRIKEKSTTVAEMSKAMSVLREQIEALQAENVRLEEEQRVKYEKVLELKKTQEIGSGNKDVWSSSADVFKADVFPPCKPSLQSQVSLGFEAKTSNWASFGNSDSQPMSTSGPKLTKFRAIYQFDARNEDELSLKPGDVVEVDENQDADPGWMGGRLGLKTGWFPEAYVEKITDSMATSEPSAVTTTEPKDPFANDTWSSPPQNSAAKSVSAIKDSFEAAAAASATPPSKSSTPAFDASSAFEASPFDIKPTLTPAPTAPSVSAVAAAPERSATPIRVAPGVETVTVRRCVSLYPFYSSEAGDLNFDVGVTIEVSVADGDWWTGTFADKTGIFPANYVREIEPIVKPSPTPPKPEHPTGNLDVPTGKQTPQGSSKSGRSTRLGSESGGDSRGDSRAESRSRSRRESVGRTRELELATAIASFEAFGSGQLSLVEGQTVAVRKKNPSGWWEGELQIRGKKRQVGWFPGDYVKIERIVEGRSSSTTPNPEPVSIAAAAASAAAATSSSTSASPQSASMGVPVESVVALYNYTAMNDDELSFLKGNLITNVQKDEVDWWRGDLLEGDLGSRVKSTGLFPANYVQPHTASGESQNVARSSSRGSSDFTFDDDQRGILSHRQAAILELIETEEAYHADISIVMEVFRRPLSSNLAPEEIDAIFVNWHEISQANDKLLRALRVRKKMCKKNKKQGSADIIMIGDILCENMPHFASYIRYCSCQLKASTFIQRRLEQDSTFKEALSRCSQHPSAKGMPLSSFLLKPMQRITKYPLLIKQILKYTPEKHPDYEYVKEAAEKADELCVQVNEGVREKENTERLEWLQSHVQCESQGSSESVSSSESIVFNSLTNSLGPRKFLHAGTVTKVKSNKELVGFLFNDFLLLTQAVKPLNKPFIMDVEADMQLKTYRQPIFLNEVEVSTFSEEDETVFQLNVGPERQPLLLKAHSRNERLTWVRKILNASKSCLDLEKKLKAKKESAKKIPAVGRLLITIVEARDLVDRDDNGLSDPYCHATMGSQENRTEVAQRTLSPTWNASMQFLVHDLDQDVLCLTVYDKDYFTPDDFMGRSEISIKDIHASLRERDQRLRGPISKHVPLNEVSKGELVVKLDLQLFNQQ